MIFPQEAVEKIKRDVALLDEQFHPANITRKNAILGLLELFNPTALKGGFCCPYEDCGHQSRLKGIVSELFFNGFSVICLKCRRHYDWKKVCGLEAVTTNPQQTIYIALAHISGMSDGERNRRMLSPPPKVKKEDLH